MILWHWFGNMSVISGQITYHEKWDPSVMEIRSRIFIYCINYKMRVQSLSIVFDHKPAYFVGKKYQTFVYEI